MTGEHPDARSEGRAGVAVRQRVRSSSVRRDRRTRTRDVPHADGPVERTRAERLEVDQRGQSVGAKVGKGEQGRLTFPSGEKATE